MRAAAYIRVSTQEQAMHGYSLDAQRDRIQEYADKNGHTIVEWYADEGISGRKAIKNRPALMRMGQEAAAGKFDLILFIKLDRFFRSVKEYYAFEELSKGCPWNAIDEPIYDTLTATGRMNINIKLSISQLEAEQTAERVKMTNEYKRKNKLVNYGPQSCPFGFTVDSSLHLIHDPEHEQDLIDIIDYYMMHQSLRACCLWAKDRGLSLTTGQLSLLLRNTLLYGEYHGISDFCEPYITKEQFDKMQIVLARKYRRVTVGQAYLFSALVKCPECDRTLFGTKQSSYNAYRCSGFMLQHRCSFHSAVYENTIEKKMLAKLGEMFSDSSVPALDVAGATKKRGRSDAAINEELDRLNYAWQKGRLSVEEYDKQYDKLTAELAANKVQETPTNIEDVKIKLGEGWRAVYNALDREHKRDFWQSFIKRIILKRVMNGKKGGYEIDRIEFL